jgi:hypothetical protein
LSAVQLVACPIQKVGVPIDQQNFLLLCHMPYV